MTRWARCFILCALCALCTAALIAAGCAGKTTRRERVALIAPFEGRARAVGYNALYAAQMAAADAGVDLLPLDDGEDAHDAQARAMAAALDPTIVGVVALGEDATSSAALAAYGGLTVFVVGKTETAPAAGVTVLDVPVAPDAAFSARYGAMSQFAPTPDRWAPVVYAAVIAASER